MIEEIELLQGELEGLQAVLNADPSSPEAPSWSVQIRDLEKRISELEKAKKIENRGGAT